MKFNITKSTGEITEYSELKLRKSLLNSGTPPRIADEIIKEIEKELYPGISSQKIYKKAFHLLKTKKEIPAVSRYKLKQAVMELGPSGYPFEKYIGEILKFKGYHVKIGQIIKGHCVNHEVDVIAEKDSEYIMVECKFHNNSGYSSDVKTPLYINSRFIDIERQLKKSDHFKDKIIKGWIVTNTRFSKDAIQYGTCSGLHLLSWDFPENENLMALIERTKLYPVTTLTTISNVQKKKLLDMKVVLCREILENKELLGHIELNNKKISEILDECYKLYNS